MNVKPKKALGQHFLRDLSIAQRIADTTLLSPYDSLPVVEIGPGMGVLTQFLIRQPRDVMAIEIDTESVDYLHTHCPDLKVIEADFLTLSEDQLPTGEFVLTGNYPYNISSQIFFRLLDLRQRIPLCTGMLQREVAERICAPEGSRTRGILSVLLQMWYDCRYLFTVSEGVFNPPPKVKSGVLSLSRNSRTTAGCDEHLFRTIVKTTFGQRRKTLRNSLKSIVGKDSPLLADPICNLRPEALSVDEFIRLTNLVAECR